MAKIREFEFPEESGFPLVAKGAYHCTIFDIEEGTSAKGNPMYTFRYKIQDEGKFKGQMLFEVYTILPTTMWRLQQLLRTFGITVKGKQRVDLDALLGAHCDVIVIHENYEGEARARVSKVTAKETLKVEDVLKTEEDIAADIEYKEETHFEKMDEVGKQKSTEKEKLPEW